MCIISFGGGRKIIYQIFLLYNFVRLYFPFQIKKKVGKKKMDFEVKKIPDTIVYVIYDSSYRIIDFFLEEKLCKEAVNDYMYIDGYVAGYVAVNLSLIVSFLVSSAKNTQEMRKN